MTSPQHRQPALQPVAIRVAALQVALASRLVPGPAVQHALVVEAHELTGLKPKAKLQLRSLEDGGKVAQHCEMLLGELGREPGGKRGLAR